MAGAATGVAVDVGVSGVLQHGSRFILGEAWVHAFHQHRDARDVWCGHGCALVERDEIVDRREHAVAVAVAVVVHGLFASRPGDVDEGAEV